MKSYVPAQRPPGSGGARTSDPQARALPTQPPHHAAKGAVVKLAGSFGRP